MDQTASSLGGFCNEAILVKLNFIKYIFVLFNFLSAHLFHLSALDAITICSRAYTHFTNGSDSIIPWCLSH
jgi:hypothetical protein